MLTYSVVVPVYNAEKFLDECVRSVLAQTTKSKFELILVDDGSSDQSGEMCDKYAEQYSCVHSLHQKNQGVSAARNAGIQAAGGEYILFLDGDDSWDQELLTQMDTCIDAKPDVIEFGFENVYTDKSGDITIPAWIAAGETGREYLTSVFAKGVMPIASSCTAAYRVAFLKDHGIAFPLGVRYGEDLDFRMQCLTAAESVVGVAMPLYRYRIHGASTINNPSAQKVADQFRVCAKVYRMYPCAVLANYYCMGTLVMAKLSGKDSRQLKGLLNDNKDILDHVSGKKTKVVKMLYCTLGWYGGAKAVQMLVRLKHMGRA